MDKRYIIVFAVAVAAAVGFFIYKDKKMENELETHNRQQYERIIEVANSSSVAGLGQMGLALIKYKKEKGNYPDTLSALYPDYIPVKAFIDEFDYTFPILLDTDGAQGQIYGARGIPTSYFIDQQGYVMAGVPGAIDWTTSSMIEGLELLLKERH